MISWNKWPPSAATATAPSTSRGIVRPHRKRENRTRPALQRQTSGASPAVLEPQAFGEVATEIVLSEVLQLALQIDPDLTADVAPAPTERIILGKVAAGIGIDHAVEE